jgi:TolB-like protein/Tfp pilus assembly protein PilF
MMGNIEKKNGSDAEETSVFFSYSRVDQQQALPIIAAIERAGYKVWWDGMLEGGTSFLETTEEALESAKAVVVLWSQTSITSHWVRDEAMSGRVRERLIPLSLDGTVPPLGFRQVQVIDFENWVDSDQAPVVRELHRVLAGLHGRTPRKQAPLTTPKKRFVSRRMVLVGASGLGGAALAGMAGLALTGQFPFGQARIHGNSIAVLPFQNLGRDTDTNYIATGLSSEIRDYLAQNKSLRVVARSSSQAIAKQALSAKAMAKRLGVAHLFGGNIRVTKNTIRVTAELIDAKTGFSSWSKEFIHSADDILSVRTSITEALIPILTTQKGNRRFDPKDGGTQNPAAFNEYLKGTALFNATVDKEVIGQALNHINIAIRLDPNFGTAYAKKAQILLWLGTTSADSATAQAYFKSAITAAKLSVSFSPNLARAHSTLGYVLVAGQLDIQSAQIPYNKSMELGYGDATVLARYATYMSVISKNEEAIVAVKRAVELDPLNASIHQTSGLIYYAARQYEEAIISTRRALEISPKFANSYAQIGMSMINLERIEEGLNACAAETNPMERLPCIAIGQKKLGNNAAAEAALDDLINRYGDAGMYQQVQILSAWGDLDKAMEKLLKAVELRDSGLTFAGFDPTLDPLRERDDFLNVLAQIGLKG